MGLQYKKLYGQAGYPHLSMLPHSPGVTQLDVNMPFVWNPPPPPGLQVLRLLTAG